MELFNEINSFIKRSKSEISIFKLLLLYHDNNEDKLCYDVILEVTSKIESDMVIYSKEKSEELYNTIDNDFFTLKELYEEFKKEVYPCFPVKGVMLLSVLPKTDVDKIYNFLVKYLDFEETRGIDALVFQIYKTLMYFPSVEYRNNVKDFLSQTVITSDRLESVMGSIKQHKKDLKSEGLENSYIELLAMYFNYLVKEFKHV
ncbi:MAG: hypothetical protein IJB21_04800 [Bacilli bacterium]|nr:hypothetical protein [Bacilli bacterium]